MLSWWWPWAVERRAGKEQGSINVCCAKVFVALGNVKRHQISLFFQGRSCGMCELQHL